MPGLILSPFKWNSFIVYVDTIIMQIFGKRPDCRALFSISNNICFPGRHIKGMKHSGCISGAMYSFFSLLPGVHRLFIRRIFKRKKHGFGSEQHVFTFFSVLVCKDVEESYLMQKNLYKGWDFFCTQHYADVLTEMRCGAHLM